MHWIDPDQLPEITGIVDQFLVNKHGEHVRLHQQVQGGPDRSRGPF
jgi:hypothetical protein